MLGIEVQSDGFRTSSCCVRPEFGRKKLVRSNGRQPVLRLGHVHGSSLVRKKPFILNFHRVRRRQSHLRTKATGAGGNPLYPHSRRLPRRCWPAATVFLLFPESPTTPNLITSQSLTSATASGRQRSSSTAMELGGPAIPWRLSWLFQLFWWQIWCRTRIRVVMVDNVPRVRQSPGVKWQGQRRRLQKL